MEKLRGCGLLIKQIHDELRKNANNALRPLDITLVQLDALESLSQAPEGQRTLKELEQILHVAQSTAAGIIARLEQKGFVEGFGDAGLRDKQVLRRLRDGPGFCDLHDNLHLGQIHGSIPPFSKEIRAA